MINRALCLVLICLLVLPVGVVQAREVWSPSPHNFYAWPNSYGFSGSWDSAAVSWYQQNQYYTIFLRYRLWWESEMRATSGNIRTYYDGTPITASNLPDYFFEFQQEEVCHQTRSPHRLVAGTWYSATASMTPAANQPANFSVGFESELTDWQHMRAYWDTKGTGLIPGAFNFQ